MAVRRRRPSTQRPGGTRSRAASLLSRLDDATKAIRRRARHPPSVGIVLGSGLGAFADSLEDAVAMPFGDIPHFPAPTVSGHSGALVVGRSGTTVVAALKGRVHHYEGHTLDAVVFPVRVLGRLGIRSLILTNAAGAVNMDFRSGELMVLRDHINFIGSPLVGPNEDALGERFPDMTDAYDPRLRALAIRSCEAAGAVVHEGVYLAVSGPSYETPAEIRMARTLGADAVGMSTAPEAIAARHMGIRVLALSCLTNMAAGVSDQKLDHRDVLEVGERLRATLLDILRRVITGIAEGA